MNFITTQEIINTAIDQKTISESGRKSLKSYLNALDQTLDGRLDGGFKKTQIMNDVYVSVPNSLSRNVVLTKKINETMVTLLQRDQSTVKPKEEKSMFVAGLEIFLLITLFPLTIAGCGGTEYVECEESCEGSCDMCTIDDEGEENCACPSHLCHWVHNGSKGWCDKGAEKEFDYTSHY